LPFLRITRDANDAETKKFRVRSFLLRRHRHARCVVEIEHRTARDLTVGAPSRWMCAARSWPTPSALPRAPMEPSTAVGISSAKKPSSRKITDGGQPMGRYVLLWLLGIPIPILILIWAFGGLH